MATRRAALLLVLALVAAGCTRTLPPVATPGPVQPPVDGEPVRPGYGRVYVDVVDGPTEVQLVKWVEGSERLNHQSFDTETLDVLSRCTSPCVLNVPLGRYLLAFPKRGTGGTDVDAVIASPNPTVYRRALGFRQRGGPGYILGVLGAAFGGASLATGAALLPVGLAGDKHGATVAGEITLGAGAILTAISIWAIMTNPSTEQAGAAAQYGL